MKIEKVCAQDVQRLFDIEQAVFNNDAFALSKASLYYHVKHSVFFKVLVDKKTVGYILWLKRKAYYRLYSLAVLEEYQGQKIATHLLQYSLKKSTVNSFSLEVKQSNKSAIALYEKFGFKKRKILKEYYPNEDGILMELEM